MKRYAATLKTVLLLTSTLGLSLAAQEAWAGPQVFDFGPDTCTTLNCNSLPINGTYQREGTNNANPFILQIFSTGGECVRVEGLSQAVDLEATLVAPNGTVWRDDDGGNGTLPLIKAITPTGVRGWYTLQIAHFAGTGSYSDFSLAYGRYTSNNVNCATPTVPSLAPATAVSKPAGGASSTVLPGGTTP